MLFHLLLTCFDCTLRFDCLHGSFYLRGFGWCELLGCDLLVACMCLFDLFWISVLDGLHCFWLSAFDCFVLLNGLVA